ncbi:hypothetical protein [Oceanobacillus senegalensis]|uniref:hypothetical protein n=1 Tax=Oceanobacillus senegalensis TaxID=1936063 RepID=UPI000A30DF23|nr:hypothetical protein [Oceanobacillus senegalensis]
MERIPHVLQAYGVRAEKVEEITPRLYKVFGQQQVFALKRSSLVETTKRNWENALRLADSMNLSFITPVFLTKDGQLYYEYNKSIYYMCPWIEENGRKDQESWIVNFYETIAEIHRKTRKVQRIPFDNISKSFITFRSYCSDLRQHLLTFVQQFEKNRYMSPFELLVCTQYRDIDFTLNEVEKRVTSFLHEMDDNNVEWSYTLCHGNLNTRHVKNGYFINWEKTNLNNPVLDLVTFFKEEIGSYNPNNRQYIDLFSTYMKINELTLPELHLFLIYLLSPGEYIQTISEYVNADRNKSMVQFIEKLQHEYRKVLFGIEWSEYIEKEYEQVDLDDWDS